MIVRNSGEDIIGTLENVRDHIDGWTILDTGSTDNTRELIYKGLKGVPGSLHSEAFTDFASSRNRALELVDQESTFIIMLDDTYHLKDGKALRAFLKSRRKRVFEAGYNILIQTGQALYPSTRIFRSRCEVRYRHKIHEVPVPPEGTKFAGVNCSTIFDAESAYMKQRSRARTVSDIKLLKEELIEYPSDRRLLLHLGRTHIICNQMKDARACFEEISAEKKLDNFDFEARRLLYGVALNDGEDPLAHELPLQKLAEDHPKRAEPPYYLAFLKRSAGEMDEAFEWIMKAASIEPDGGMSIQKRIYETEIPYLAADISLVCGQIKVAEKILKTYANKNSHDNRIINMIYAISDIPQPPGKVLGSPVVVFHATGSVRGWSPNVNKSTGRVKCSGSEFMAINLSTEFARMGYRVFMFGDFIGEGQEGSYNTEGTYSGVQYLDKEKYWDFLRQYVVDILIVSRDVENLVYINNVKKVFLWLHDIVPVSDSVGAVAIQYHKTKFKKVICLCDWHAKNVSTKYNVPAEFMATSRNSISVNRFRRELKKVPFRFIYASAADRGLEYLLKIIPKVKEVFPETTLHIFADLPEQLEKYRDMREFCDSSDYIFLRGRVTHDEIIHEFLVSDIFFYPTDFTETYCITAVEAQAAGLLCVCSDLAALKEIVGDRGITVGGSIVKEEVQEKMLKELLDVMGDPPRMEKLRSSGRSWALQQGHEELAKEWRKDFFKL